MLYILREITFLIPEIPIPIPVMIRITAKIIAAMLSNLSCPYGCDLSDFLFAILTPNYYNY